MLGSRIRAAASRCFYWGEKQSACRLLKLKRVCPPDGKDLYIGKAVQKAYLEVTEEGSEGAIGSGRLSN